MSLIPYTRHWVENGVELSEIVTVETPSVLNAATLRTRADEALADLRTIATSSGTLTAAQLSNAVRLCARVLIALVRLHLSKLDDVT